MIVKENCRNLWKSMMALAMFTVICVVLVAYAGPVNAQSTQSCLETSAACTDEGQCCTGECSYGRCQDNAVAGAQGTFCERHDDCANDACCVREPAINPHISICKLPLEENMVCGPVNFFKNVYVGAQVQSSCGPCAEGLVCKQVGIFGVHEICVKDE